MDIDQWLRWFRAGLDAKKARCARQRTFALFPVDPALNAPPAAASLLLSKHAYLSSVCVWA
ncbi:hypothetical protein JXA32_10590 [Candidatus Sumerlaeota bacterium]|nr:hypothetical protein [Candidatus Sumerlaeota bacterium]